MVKLLAEHAPAKINLCLQITGRRPDGYHELDSIFVPIRWSDAVRIEVRRGKPRRVALRCDVAAIGDSESNLASRAAASFMREFTVDAEVEIDLRKRIPMGAGLGGGSSDAGAVLRMMAQAFGIPVDERMIRVAVGLGADVPFFLDPRPARVRGIGELIEALAGMPRLELVIAVPAVEVPTARIFKALERNDWSGPLKDDDLRAILQGQIGSPQVRNDLAPAAMRLYPEIARLKASLEEAGASAAAMSGSGGAVFGIFPDAAAAQAAARTLKDRARDAIVRAVSSIDVGEMRGMPILS
jgi:4-diphosphocytidyl-2-C-methyl-D-erythritol kinase